ncbi:MAG: AAA family ATPase [Dysgonamonadaceae bacterium]|jgi:exodeoxyribonuclease-5|nr:AAA family ATPase [Dysgonamonadaceae bacterium]
MLSDAFPEKIKKNFAYIPTPEQETALNELSEFIFSRDAEALFLLKGYAGTGKSSLTGAFVKTLSECGYRTVLLAPTGRSAKVFALYAAQNAYTIHKKIYRQKVFSNDPSGFVLMDNLHKHTLFIVDEASMISNQGMDSFGSGNLLDDLISYVYSGEGCRLMLLGDSAQLPPVMQEESPALDEHTLRCYGLNVKSLTLTQIVRQAESSGILMNATQLRNALASKEVSVYPKISVSGYDDMATVSSDELIEQLANAYGRDGIEETIVISRSNKRATIFNNGIRNRILYREEELSSGDLLMVAKNNYYWNKNSETMEFIANGDLMQVLRVRKEQHFYGFRFCDLTVRFPDYDLEMDLKILMETLHTDSPGLPKEMSDRLFYAVMEDYADIGNKREKLKRLKENPYFNAVQVKYAYSVTCHKAQGGQWKNVFVDLSYIPEEYLNTDFYRWLYTAFTRATNRIFLINPVKEILAT